MTARRPEALVEAPGRPASVRDAPRSARPAVRPEAEHPRARLAARLAYVAVVLLATLTRLQVDPSLRFAGWRLYRALNPTFHAQDFVDGVRNVVLFAGLGAVWVVTARTLRVWPAVWRATAVGVALSVAVESAQLFSPARFASVLDVLTNGVGAFAGAAVLAVVTRLAAAARSRASVLPPPAFLLAVPYLAAALLEAFSPAGRTDRVPGAAGGPAARFQAALDYSLAHLSAGIPPSNLVLVAPVGTLAVILLAELGFSTMASAVLATASGLALFAGAELARGVAGGDMRPLAVALHGLAVLLGAVVGALLLSNALSNDESGGRDPRRGWRDLVRGRLDGVVRAGYVAALLCWSWRPFAVKTSLAEVTAIEPAQLVPLATTAASFSLYGVADVGIGFLLYVPVGAWLSAHPLRRRGALAYMLPGIYLALASELLQLVIRGRTFDITDILVQTAGVCVGWIVLRRADRLHAAIMRARAG